MLSLLDGHCGMPTLRTSLLISELATDGLLFSRAATAPPLPLPPPAPPNKVPSAGLAALTASATSGSETPSIFAAFLDAAAPERPPTILREWAEEVIDSRRLELVVETDEKEATEDLRARREGGPTLVAAGRAEEEGGGGKAGEDDLGGEGKQQAAF
jgi:hypothetical protein